jgi:hypothetical protein
MEETVCSRCQFSQDYFCPYHDDKSECPSVKEGSYGNVYASAEHAYVDATTKEEYDRLIELRRVEESGSRT